MSDDPNVQGAMAARLRLDEAMRTGDVATLGSLFAGDLVVQTPTHRIVDGPRILAVYSKAGQATYDGGMTATFDFVGASQGAVVMMGEEVMPPAPSGPNAGKTVRRRFTDVWREIDGAWKLTVRQATNISVE